MKLLILAIILIFGSNVQIEKPAELPQTSCPQKACSEEYNPIQECVDRLIPIYEARQSPIPVDLVCEHSLKDSVDPVLVTSIFIIESGLHGNCFLQKYNAGCVRVRDGEFASWNDSIGYTTSLLRSYRESYGLITAEEIARRYCPPTWETWARDVNYLIMEMK